MHQLLLDSDIVSEVLKGRNAPVEKNKTAYAAAFHKLSFTSAGLLEILYGLEGITWEKRG